jgi:hypothetical protein
MENEIIVHYVTSTERLARLEGRLEARAENRLRGRIELLQELLKLPASSDEELEAMAMEQLQSLYSELRERFDSRRRLSSTGSQAIDSGSSEAHSVDGVSELT